MKTKKLYEFGEFRIDPDERVLISGERIVSLAPKVFETLFLLVENRGNIVSKDELMNNIWSDSFVEEGNLTQNIYTLRQTLGKDFIETVPRRGYRFAKPVTIKSAGGESENFKNSDENGNYIVATRTRTSLIEETSIEDNARKSAAGVAAAATANTAAAAKSKKTAGRNLARPGIYLVLASALLLAFGYVAYEYLQNRQKSSDSSKIIAGKFEFEPLTETGNAYSPSISPDGKFVAYIKRDAYSRALRLKDIASGNDVELTIKNGVVPEFLQFAPDGRHIFFRTEGRVQASREIYRVSYFGGTAKLVAADAWGAFSVSPDGSQIAFYRRLPLENKQFIVVKNLETGAEKRFAERTLPKNLYMPVYPAWSAAGEQLTFIPLDGRSNRSKIGFIDLTTGREKIVETGQANIRQTAFLPDTRHLLFVARKKAFQIYSLDRQSGAVKRITNDLNNYRNLSISADGSRIITQQRKLESDLWLVPAGDSQKALPLTEAGHFGLLDLTAINGDRIIYDAKGDLNRDLRLSSFVDGTQMTLSRDDNSIRNHTPVAEAGGNRIYFVSNKSGAPDIWRINSDGTGLAQITFGKENELNIAPALSPDGKWLYFLKKRGDSNSIWKKSLAGEASDPLEIFRAEDFSFGVFTALSPDGAWLAFHYLDRKQIPLERRSFSKSTKIGFLNLLDPSRLKIFEIETERPRIRWTNGGRSFDYQGTRDEGKIWRQDFEDELAARELVFQIPQERLIHFDWTPDEENLVVARGRHLSDAVMLETVE